MTGTPDFNLDGLITILARVDALFLPLRPNRPGPQRAAQYELQTQYRAQGLRFSGTGADSRKDFQQTRDNLAAQGLIRLRQLRSDRTVSVQLTARGEAVARASCELPSLAASIAAIDELYQRQQDDGAAEHAGFVWVREAIMAGTQIEDVDDEARLLFAVVEQIMLPALIRGWSLANSDNAGHCWWSLSPKFKRLPSQVVKPPATIKTPRPSVAMLELYAREMRQEHSRLESVPVEGQDIGMIPMPASPITRGQAAKKLEAQNV